MQNRWPMGICCMTQGTQTGALYWWDEDGNGREVQEGGDICISMADWCWCLIENDKIL